MPFAEALMSETRRIRSGGKRLEAGMKETGWQKRWSAEGNKMESNHIPRPRVESMGQQVERRPGVFELVIRCCRCVRRRSSSQQESHAPPLQSNSDNIKAK